VWLRHNCRCVECIHAGNGQRHVEVADLPEDPAVETVWAEGALVRIRFRPDGHEGVFDRERLERWCRDDDALPYDPRTEDAKRLWPAGGGGAVRELAWAAYCDDDSAKAAALDGVLFDGAVLLTGVPARQRMVLDVARSFGFVRRTNYGELFDVRVEPNPTNLAFTSMSIAPHTDNPYRDPVPTVQLLHCLGNSAAGGRSGLVDGFRVAASLREQRPAAFAEMASTPVTFAFDSDDARLSATRPMIDVDLHGRVREIRFNERSMQPVRLPAGAVEQFYGAYRAFARLLRRPELQHRVRLAPGDCLVFDNTRMLHARTAFETGTGTRHPAPPGLLRRPGRAGQHAGAVGRKTTCLTWSSA
jgi:gamma-butyrobetaine dioxygenase